MGREIFGSEPSRSLSLQRLQSSSSVNLVPHQSHSSSPLTSTATSEPDGSPVPDRPSSPRTLVLENYAAAQDSLRQASATLDAAFNRLRELRRSLHSFRNGMASNSPLHAYPESRSDYGPPYTAIVLTRASSDLPSPPSPPTSEPPNPPAMHTWTEFSPFRFIYRPMEADDIPSLVRRTDGDSDSNPTLAIPRARLQWRVSARVNHSTDEPSTSLGRRIASRQANDAPASNFPRLHRSSSVIDAMRATHRQREDEPRASPIGSGQNPSDERLPLTSTASLRALRDSRERLRMESRATTPRAVPRLPRSEDFDADHVESRTYRVRRRLNADGDELMQTLDMDSGSANFQDPVWDMPSRRRLPTLMLPLDMDENLVADNAQRNLNSSTVRIDDATPHPLPTAVGRRVLTRRRAWARLDADGNEISTDEEDALERARAQIRAREQSFSGQNLFQIVRERLGASERSNEEMDSLPATQYTTRPGVIDENYVSHVRGRIIGRETLGTDVSLDQRNSLTIQPSSPYHVNPLPMPLADMVVSYSKPQPRVHSADIVEVSRFAHLAGR